MDRNVGLERAISIVGSQKALAAILGVSPQSVSQWVNGSRPLPSEHCPVIEEATGKLVVCEELFPNFRWDVLRTTRAKRKRSAEATGA
ncbi:transcriptional regulator [Achromobacter insuavis]|uniref:transcriptional regulator n=1 Tax=Achromobacter insuavis TaxID=1287735 RepID=UPI0015D1E270